MILDCAHYRDGARQNEGPLAIAEAAERAREDGFVWLGLHDPEDGELTEVAARFDLPPLAVEDALKAHQRPKLELYHDTLFVVLRTAQLVGDAFEIETLLPLPDGAPRPVITAPDVPLIALKKRLN